MFYLSICPFIQPRTEVGNGKIIDNYIVFIKLVQFLEYEGGDIGYFRLEDFSAVCLPGLT